MKKTEKIIEKKFVNAILFIALTLSLTNTPFETYATHFRHGNISWTHVSGRQVAFHVSQAWRRSYPWTPSYPNVGNIVNTGTLNFGDGTAPINLMVTSVNLAEDIFYGEAFITHTYSGTGTIFTAFFANCCRLSAPPGGLLMNNGDLNFRVQTVVNLQPMAPHNNSPVASLPAIVSVPTGLAAASFQLTASDPDVGQSYTCTLSTPAQMGPGTIHPPGLTVSPTGLVTFNTIGKAIGTFWNTQFMVTDTLGATTAVDFLIKIIPQANPPYFNYAITPANNSIIEIQPGNQLCININAADYDAGDVVSLSSSGLPSGATLTPSLPASGNPIQTQLFWTPTIFQLGIYPVSFNALDLNGNQTNTNLTIIVSTNPVFDVPQSPGQGDLICVECGINHCVTVQAHAPDPLVNVQITSAVVPIGCTISPGIPSVSGNTTSIEVCWSASAADFGPHTVSFTATDGSGHTQNHTFTLVANTTPSFTSTPAGLTISENQPFLYQIITSDPDEPFGDELEIEAITLPAWLTFTDHSDGTATLIGTPSLADVGINHVRIDVEDTYHHCHAEVSQEFDIIVTACNVAASITPAPIPQNGVYCPGTSVNLQASPADSYLWNTNASSSSITVTAGSTAVYTVTTTQAYCIATASFSVTGSDTQKPIISCPGSITINNTPNNCGAIVNYSVTGSDNCSAYTLTQTNGLASGALFPLGTTTNTFVVSDASNNTETCSFNITVNAVNSTIPAKPGTITGPATVCKNSYVTYTIAAVPGATSYTWFVSSGASVNTGQGTTSGVIFLGPLATNATLSVVANNSCGSSAANTLSYMVSTTAPTKPLTINGPLNGNCNLNNVAYSCPVVANALSYQWTVPAGVTILTGQGTNAITVKYTVAFTTSGIISVTAINGCGSSPVQSRTVNSKPAQPVISGLNWTCKNQAGVVYSVAPIAGATSYTWTVVSGSVLVSGQGTTSIVVNWGNIDGVITCKANNACGSSLAGTKPVSFTCRDAVRDFSFSELNLFPNPASATARLQFESYQDGNAQLTILSLIGQQLLFKNADVKTGINQYILDLTKFPKGIYTVKLKHDGFSRSTKLAV